MNSHKSILKTSLITGGSQVIVMLFNIIRAKSFAVFLGPEGTGVIGLYSSAIDLISSISGLGISSSAVREIAHANKKDDKLELRKILFVFRWLIRITASLGALVLFSFASIFSKNAFGNVDHALSFRCLSMVILISSFTSGQYGLLQGLRKIKILALSKITGTIGGTIISIGIIYFLRDKGILPFIILGSIFTFIVSWYYTQKENLNSTSVNFVEFKTKASNLLKVGVGFLISGLTVTMTAYYSRIYISDLFSIEYLGIYTACWTLSAVYVNFILSAMGIDFYPRLTEIISDNENAKKLVNEQTEVGLLMSVLGVLSILIFSALALKLFYTNKFELGSNLLKWMTLGMAIKIVTWPLGFIVVAKGKMKLFASLEISWGILYILLLHVFSKLFGYDGIGIAFFVTYLIYGFFVWISAKYLISFEWSKHVSNLLMIFVAILLISFFMTRVSPPILQNIFGSFILFATSIWVYWQFSLLFNKSPLAIIKGKFIK